MNGGMRNKMNDTNKTFTRKKAAYGGSATISKGETRRICKFANAKCER